MRIYNSRKGYLSIPLYDIGSIISGFYIGYNEGKGIDITQTVEYLTKYGPTAIAVCTTPLIIKVADLLRRYTKNRMKHDLENENFEVNIGDKTIKFSDMNEVKKKEMEYKMKSNILNLEEKIQNTSYLKPILISGSRTAFETLVAYTAGRIFSHIY